MNEVWKPVLGWEMYEVSNLGNVRSLDKLIPMKNGQMKLHRGIVRRSNPHPGGYIQIKLRDFDRVGIFQVHRLVATAFLSNPYNHPCVNHKDFNPSNNHAGNLEWCTQAYNIQYSAKAGRMSMNRKGKRSNSAKLTDAIAEEIRKEYAYGGTSYQKLAAKYSSNKKSVMRIINGETYVQL